MGNVQKQQRQRKIADRGVVVKTRGREEMEVTANGFEGFFWGDGNVPELESWS